MAQPTAIAPYDDGSSTESECYDEDLLELAASSNNEKNEQNLAPESTTDVKGKPLPVKSEATEETKPKAKTTYNKCKRCRRKRPIVSEKEQEEVQQGKLSMKRWACCCEHFPLTKFSMANRSSTRAIPRCRSCTQAPPEILHRLRKSPEYVEAATVEMEKIKAERKEKRAKLPRSNARRPSSGMRNNFNWSEARRRENEEWHTARKRRRSGSLAFEA